MARWSLVGAIWLSFVVLIFVAWCAYDLPGMERLNEFRRRPSVTLLAADGSLIASFGDLYGNTVELEDLPPYLPEAVLATEDRRFYDHFGLDLRGLARAVYVNIKEGELTQGGSTVTQQLAKNIFLTPERTLHRKGQEVLLALWLEKNFTKEEILELYLNRVYFGAGTYGVDAASRKYFGKTASEVSIFEAAMLAGMLKAPSRYNPFNDKELARERARLVISNMVAADYLTPEEAQAISEKSAPSVSAKAKGQIGQYFSDWVIDQVSSYVGYPDQDLVVETTLDPKMQREAESDIERIMKKLGPDMNASQAALVAMSPDGAVRAMVGGTNYRQTQFNRATQAQRQPGSAFKAFVYLAAFENGYTPESRFTDQPIRIGNWQPANYEDKFHGEVDLRDAFARSMNSVAVQLSERTGRASVIDAAHRLGLTGNLDTTPAVALGVSETSVLEMTAAYATFGNLGNGVWPRGIERITTRDGTVLYERLGSGPGQVVGPTALLRMLDVMNAVVEGGTGRKAKLDRPVYGKTGTSQNFRDAWFIGVTRDLTTGVWVGNDDNSPMNNVTGGKLPVTIWHDFMAKVLKSTPPEDVRRPAVPTPVAAADMDDGGFIGWLEQEIFSPQPETPAGATEAPVETSTNKSRPASKPNAVQGNRK